MRRGNEKKIEGKAKLYGTLKQYMRYPLCVDFTPYRLQLMVDITGMPKSTIGINCHIHYKKIPAPARNRYFKLLLQLVKSCAEIYYSITILRVPLAATTTYTPFCSTGMPALSPL